MHFNVPLCVYLFTGSVTLYKALRIFESAVLRVYCFYTNYFDWCKSKSYI